MALQAIGRGFESPSAHGRAEPAEVICGEVRDFCRCVVAPDHEGAHVCSCRGSWDYDEEGRFVFVGAPSTGRSLGDTVADFLGIPDDEE